MGVAEARLQPGHSRSSRGNSKIISRPIRLFAGADRENLIFSMLSVSSVRSVRNRFFRTLFFNGSNVVWKFIPTHYSNSKSKRSLRWLVEGSSTFPLSISLPEGESTLFTLSLWERVAEGRVRASVAFFLAALISSLI
jgi:hypothetical protein